MLRLQIHSFVDEFEEGQMPDLVELKEDFVDGLGIQVATSCRCEIQLRFGFRSAQGNNKGPIKSSGNKGKFSHKSAHTASQSVPGSLEEQKSKVQGAVFYLPEGIAKELLHKQAPPGNKLSKITKSFLAGMAASGAFTSALRLITKAAFENSKDGLRKGAMLFFSISTFFELLCVLLYALLFPKLPIVKYYRSKAASEGLKTVSADLAAGGIKMQVTQKDEEDTKERGRLTNKQLLFENIDYALDMFLINVLTLSIFPGFLSEDTGSHSLGSWYALVLIAMYNVFDLIGRYIPLLKCWKITSRRGRLLATLSRFLLIPAFYFTAKYGDQGWMILLTSFLGLSNGYLTVCVLTTAPKGYKGPEKNALGNLLVLFLLAGIFAGVMLDWLWLIGKGW